MMPIQLQKMMLPRTLSQVSYISPVISKINIFLAVMSSTSLEGSDQSGTHDNGTLKGNGPGGRPWGK